MTSSNSLPTPNPTAYESKLHLPANSPRPRIRLMEYDRESLIEREISDPHELAPYAHTKQTTWIDIQGLGDEECLRTVARIFGIHDTALADAVNVPQRAKTQAYGDYLIVVIRAPLAPFDAMDRVPQVCLLLAENFVVTFQERDFAFFDDVRNRIRDEASMLRGSRSAFLSYALTDALVDQYYPIVEEISDSLDEIEAEILDNPSPALMSQVQQLQRKLTTLRRVARPQVESLYKLSHADTPLIPSDVAIFLKDAEDHARQILGRLDASREIATDMMSAVLATLGHRQNEVMKVLTLVGGIFIPLTFMAGIYGMNFEYMPELKVRAAYPILLGAMAIVAIGMVTLFRVRGWIGGGTRK
jgi:magnesium transporter